MAKSKQQEQTQEPAEKLSRAECANKVVRAWLDSGTGDTTMAELSAKADALFVAGRDGNREYSDVDGQDWYVRKVLDSLEGLGLLEMEWHCAIHPKVRLGDNGND